MEFGIGYIAGLGTSILIFTILNLFKAPIDKTVSYTQTKLRATGLRPKGFVFVPESDAEVIRKEIIAKNAAEGRDTPINELL